MSTPNPPKPAPPPPAKKPRASWKSRLASFGLVVLSLLIAFTIAEVIVRIAIGDQVTIFPRNVTGADYGGYQIRRNVPNATYAHKSVDGHWKFRINAQGMRADVNYAYAKPPGKVRVMTLGDSFTAGYEVAQHETYAAVLQRALQQRGIAAEVLNAGVSGFSTAEALVYLEHEGFRYAPDVVVLGFYANDLDDNIRSGLYALKGDSLVQMSKSYLPAIRVRDWLNAIPPYRWLSAHSYLHNYLNQALTYKVRDIVYKRNASRDKTTAADTTYHRRLAARLVERMAALCAQRGIQFILLDINEEIAPGNKEQLRPSFPRSELRPAVAVDVMDSGALLQPYAGLAFLYRPRGHRHWTPLSHLIVGDALAARIAEARQQVRTTDR